MIGKLTPAKFLALGLCSTLLPCLASAIDMPSGPSLEQVDTSNLGNGQDVAPARAAGSWAIQVGAFVDKDKAEARLDHVAGLKLDDLSQAARAVTPMQWDEAHTLYRARFTGLSAQSALALCARLSHRGESCFAAMDDAVRPADNAAADIVHAPVYPISANLIDTTAVTSSALDAFAVTAPTLQEIVDPPGSVVTAGSTTATTRPLATANLAGPPTVTGAVIKEAAQDSPILRANLDQPAPAQTAAVVVAVNDRVLVDSSRLVSNDELSGMRGGFFTAAGAQFDFGASIRTMVNGQLALLTTLQWTPAGSVVTQLSGLGASIDAQVNASLASAGIGTANAGGTTPLVIPTTSTSNPTAANTPVSAPVASFVNNTAAGALQTASNALGNSSPGSGGTPAGVQPTTVTIPALLTGVQIPSPGGGSTQVFSNVNANQIQNIILNSASGQTISQNTNVTLTIYNFQAWQQQLAQHALFAQLANELLAASGLGH